MKKKVFSPLEVEYLEKKKQVGRNREMTFKHHVLPEKNVVLASGRHDAHDSLISQAVTFEEKQALMLAFLDYA